MNLTQNLKFIFGLQWLHFNANLYSGKKKHMKKLQLFILLILTMVLLCSCADVSKVMIDYGKSEVYSQLDMDLAIDVIKSEFRSWDGCILDSITYLGDKTASEQIDYCNEIADAKTYDECIVFTSVYHTSQFINDPVLEAGETIEGWDWYLARTNGGEWDLVTYGYA